jgi:NAD(P)-dependent dehydrogenase (short-subunit alcohol dehydrogenase family)
MIIWGWMMTDWGRKSWFITGASSGFGRSIAQAVLAMGGRVIATARDISTLDDLVAGSAGRAIAVPLDVRDTGQMDRALEAARAFGGFDVLLNNAGYGFLGGVEESTDAEITAQMDVNFFGPLRLIRAVLPSMRAQGAGYIVNMSSIGCTRGHMGAAFYAASKFALEGLSESLSEEMRSFGIRVLIVEPGYFRTDFSGRSIAQASVPHPAYSFLARMRDRATGVDGMQAGNPDAAAPAVFAAMDSAAPPLRLLLGSDAFAFADDVLTSRRAEAEAWRAMSESTDFPVG